MRKRSIEEGIVWKQPDGDGREFYLAEVFERVKQERDQMLLTIGKLRGAISLLRWGQQTGTPTLEDPLVLLALSRADVILHHPGPECLCPECEEET
jgi:hypothetical protein